MNINDEFIFDCILHNTGTEVHDGIPIIVGKKDIIEFPKSILKGLDLIDDNIFIKGQNKK